MFDPDLVQLVAADHRRALARRAADHRRATRPDRPAIRSSVGLLLVRAGARMAHVETVVVPMRPAAEGW